MPKNAEKWLTDKDGWLYLYSQISEYSLKVGFFRIHWLAKGEKHMMAEDIGTIPEGVEVHGEITARFSEILTPEALAFAAKLERAFGERRLDLLERRDARQDRN